MPRRCERRAASRRSRTGRRSRSSTRPTGAGWRSAGAGGLSGSGTRGRGGASARCLRAPRDPAPTAVDVPEPDLLRARSRRSPSVPGACSPRRASRGSVRIWDLDDRELVRPPLRLPPFVIGVAFSPDGSQLAIPFGYNNPGSRDGVEVRDVRSGERIARLRSDAEVRSVAFSPDGRLLAGGQVDGSGSRLGDRRLASGGGAAARGRGVRRSGRPSPRTAARWPPRTTTARSRSGTSSRSSRSARRCRAWLGRWVDGALHARRRRLFAVSDNGDAIRWEVDPDGLEGHACAVAGGG